MSLIPWVVTRPCQVPANEYACTRVSCQTGRVCGSNLCTSDSSKRGCDSRRENRYSSSRALTYYGKARRPLRGVELCNCNRTEKWSPERSKEEGGGDYWQESWLRASNLLFERHRLRSETLRVTREQRSATNVVDLEEEHLWRGVVRVSKAKTCESKRDPRLLTTTRSRPIPPPCRTRAKKEYRETVSEENKHLPELKRERTPCGGQPSLKASR